ncbi:MAG: GNAT family N-acetyltransferase [Betaproteobacteria bacterium]
MLTTSEPGARLTDGLVFCRISSWLTGRRLVSLPFSDHCDVLAQEPETVGVLAAALQKQSEIEGCRYAELRPTVCLGGYATAFRNDRTFVLHRLSLRPPLDDLFQQFHRSCVQRKIRRADRERLDFHTGSTRQLVDAFYRLAVRTHRRHGVPPQPLAWFRNLAEQGGESLKIHLASKDGRPIAGVLTLRFKRTLTYKYGASDERFHTTGAMPQLLWRAIQEARELGCEQLDLGRSDIDNLGLTTFKDHWAASRSALCYWRFSTTRSGRQRRPWEIGLSQKVWTHGPERLFTMAGRLLYRHVG